MTAGTTASVSTMAAGQAAPPWIEFRSISEILAAGPPSDPHAHLRLPGDDGCPRHWKLTLGKHRGKQLCDVPAGYVRWLSRQDWLDERTRIAVADYARVYRWAGVGQ